MGPAALKFTQGATTAPAGQALVGDVAVPVVCSNGVNSPDIAEWTYELKSRPGGSSVPLEVFAGGATPTGTFTPDVRGGYRVKLTTKSTAGVVSVDERVFLVLELSGRKIPPFGSDDKSLNFSGGLLGWAEIMEEWLRYLDSISGVVNIGSGEWTVTQITGRVIINADLSAGDVLVTLNDGVPRPTPGFMVTVRDSMNLCGTFGNRLWIQPNGGLTYSIRPVYARLAGQLSLGGGTNYINTRGYEILRPGGDVTFVYNSDAAEWGIIQ